MTGARHSVPGIWQSAVIHPAWVRLQGLPLGSMITKVAVTGNTATWRRGMSASLGDARIVAAILEDISEFQPGRDGSALVVGAASPNILESVVNFSEEYPAVPIVMVIPELKIGSFARAIRGGATAVVDEDSGVDLIVTALGLANLGMTPVPGRMAAAMAQLIPEESDLNRIVSDEEVSWLRSMAGGVTVAELAERSGYSERAMFRNLRNLYLRIEARNRTEALIWASRNSLLAD